MASDLTLTRGGSFPVVHVEGNTEAGVEFLDGYTALEFTVVDAGRILVPSEGREALEIRAREAGLTFEEVTS